MKTSSSKRIFSALLASLCAISLGSCGGNASSSTPASDNPSSQSSGSASTTLSASTADNEMNEDGVTPAGVFPIVTKPTTISVMSSQVAWVSDMINNDFTKKVETETGITLDWQITPSDGYSDKLNLALSTDSYTDVILQGAASNNLDVVKRGITDKILVPLNQWIDKYGINIKQIWTDLPTIQEAMTAPDGNIYCIPSSEGAAGHGAVGNKFWINTAWIKKLGLTVPTTTEEMKTVLKAFKENDPNGNGSADEVPLSGAINTWAADPYLFLLNAFCYYDGSLLMLKDGKFSTSVTEESFKKALSYLSDLYKEGLIDPAAFTQDQASLLKLGNATPTVLGGFDAGHIAMGIDIANRELADQYEALMPLKGPDGYQGIPVNDKLYPQGGPMAVTDKCKIPAVAFRLLDYFQDGFVTNSMAFGPEGIAWSKADPGTKGVTGLDAVWRSLDVAYSNTPKSDKWGFQAMFPSRWKEKMQFEGDILEQANYEARLIRDTDAYAKFPGAGEQIRPMWADADTATKLSNQLVPINDYVKAAIVSFITGQKNIEKDWDTYLADLEKLGLTDYVTNYQKVYDENAK